MKNCLTVALVLFYCGTATGAAVPIKQEEQQKKLEETQRARGRNLEIVFRDLIGEFLRNADALLIKDAAFKIYRYGDYSWVDKRWTTIVHNTLEVEGILNQLASQPDKDLALFRRANEIKKYLFDAKKAFGELCEYLKENEAKLKTEYKPAAVEKIVQIIEKRAANEKKAPKLREEIDRLKNQVNDWISANKEKIDAIKKLESDVALADLSNPFYHEMMQAYDQFAAQKMNLSDYREIQKKYSDYIEVTVFQGDDKRYNEYKMQKHELEKIRGMSMGLIFAEDDLIIWQYDKAQEEISSIKSKLSELKKSF